MGGLKTYPHRSLGPQSAMYTYCLLIYLHHEFTIVQYSLTLFDIQAYVGIFYCFQIIKYIYFKTGRSPFFVIEYAFANFETIQTLSHCCVIGTVG